MAQTTILQLHTFDSQLSEADIFEIGKRFVRKTFVRHNLAGDVVPFCHAQTGEGVRYITVAYKLLCKGDCVVGKRLVDPTRVQRLHWIIPVIEEKAKNVMVADDGAKRRYYIAPLNYLVVLSRDREGLTLTTAYWITENWEKDRVKKQFKK